MTEKERLMSKIPTGRDNAIHARDLANLMGVDKRVLREMINNARDNGELICTGNEGVWLPENESEVRESYNRQRHMALAILKSTTGARRFLRATEKTPGVTVAEWSRKRREEKLNDQEKVGRNSGERFE